MSNKDNAQSLFYNTSYNSVSELWPDELGDGTVSQSSGITSIKYTRLASLPSYYVGQPEATISGAFQPISDTSLIWSGIESIMGDATKTGYETLFTDVANINFVASSQGTQIGAITLAHFDPTFYTAKANASGYTYATWAEPSEYKLESDVFIRNNNLSADPGSVGFFTVIHEVAHALGLDHSVRLPSTENNIKYSVMIESYASTSYYHPEMYYESGDPASNYVLGLQLYDIAAIQSVYGVKDTSTRSGDTTYKEGQGFGATASIPFIYTIWDGGGTDTINATGYADAVQIDLREGHFSSIGKNGNPNGSAVAFDSGAYDAGNVAIAYGAKIENATGTQFDDHLIGNKYDNRLIGGGGADNLYGENGDDLIIGGAGDDWIYGGYGWDTVDYGQEKSMGGSLAVQVNDLDDFSAHVLVTDSYGDADHLSDVETLVLTNGNDTVTYSYSVTPSVLEIDGGDGFNTFTFEHDHSFSFINKTGDTWNFYDSYGGDLYQLTLKNFDEVIFNYDELSFASSVLLPDMSHSSASPINVYETTNGNVFWSTDVDYSGADRGGTFIFGPGLYDNTARLGSVVHTLRTPDYLYAPHYSNTITVHADSELEGILTGRGNDIVTVNNGADIIYTGGNDTYYLQWANLSFNGGINASNITGVSVAPLNDEQTRVVISTDLGVLTIITPLINYGQNAEVSLGAGSLVITGDGLGGGTYQYVGDVFYDQIPPGSWSDDIILGGAEGDYLIGSGGNDIIIGNGGADSLHGGSGNDSLYGGADGDTMYGGFGNDTLDGGTGTNNMHGGAGDDIFIGSSGDDFFGGDDGYDIVSFANSSGAITIDLGLTSAQNTGAGWDTFYSIEKIIGSAYSDIETSSNNDNNSFFITAGLDSIVDMGGFDAIHFNTGTGLEDVSFSVSGSNLKIIQTVSVSETTITDHFVGKVIEQLQLADGFTMNLADFSSWVFLTSSGTFTGIGAANDTVIGRTTHDNIKGYDGNDVLYGGDGDDSIYGGAGDDLVHGGDGDDSAVRGGDGNDQVWGGAGRDNMRGESGNDILHGGDGNDGGLVGSVTFYMKGDSGDDEIYGDGGDDYLRGDSGKDKLYGGEGVDDARGGSGDDLIYGDAGNDTLYGDTGDDEIHGGDGNDTMRGDEGQDTLYGDAGNDDIRGGLDSNLIYGGSGDDLIYGGYNSTDTFSGNDTLYGDEGADTIRGGLGNDILDGGAGNDNLQANGGDDTYKASGGDDYISDSGSSIGDRLVFGFGVDMDDLAFSIINTDNLLVTWGAGGADSIEIENQAKSSSGNFIETLVLGDGSAFKFNNYLSGWSFVTGTSHTGDSSANTIIGNSANQTLSGGAGNDEIHGGAGADTLNGGDQDDLLHGGRGNDTINGDAGADTIYGGAGNNALNGGLGDDTYVVTDGFEVITDTGGTDTIKFLLGIEETPLVFTNIDADSSGDNDDLKITLTANVRELTLLDQRNADSALRIDTLLFADGMRLSLSRYGSSNWISSDDATISGTSSADTLLGASGNNTINGGSGDDQIYGAAGADILNGGDGLDQIHGGADNDTVKGNAGIDTIYGGSGDDILYGGSSAVSDATGETDYLYGGDGNDAIYGGLGDDFIYAEAGDDGTVRGGVGNDTLYGGAGNDGVNGNNGDDFIDGEDGDDILHGDGTTGETGADTVHGGFGADTVYGDAGIDTLYGDSGDDTVIGGTDADTLYGGAGNDKLYGGLSSTDTTDTSSDILYGDDGDDLLYGNAGDDVLYGGAGVDTLRGDDGADVLSGGADTDTFMFLTATAFSGIDTISDFVAGEDGDILNIRDLLIGYDALTDAIADYVEITTSGADSILKIDRDGTDSVYSLAQIATISGVTGLTDEAALVANGNLIVV